MSGPDGCLHCLGYRDFALSAARIAVRGSETAEDHAWIGAARFAARALAHSGRNDQAALAAYLNAECATPTPFAVNTKAHDAWVPNLLAVR